MSASSPAQPLDHGGARLAARDAWTVTKRNLRHFLRQPRLLVFSTIQPVMFVVLFSAVFGGVAAGALPEGVDYIDFLLPGIFVQSAAFRSTQTAVGLAEDLERGVIDRFRSMPMSRYAVLAGRTFADLTRNLAVLLLMTAVGYVLGFRFTEGPLAALAALAVVGLFGFVLSWIFTYVALAVPGAEAAQTAGFVAVFPLVFASSIFVPVETMPSWLQGFAANSPVTVAADASRALSIGGPTLRPVLLTLTWALAILAIAVPASVRRYRRID
ncbi:ABC transporter permease [Egicoccus sp. AB-alg6-2]|uniref:ABC transporter permease n=1 Tax=Egicoccus sp. AB-alg6-2 TaxID=3242692 RepID=UPI00359EEFD8